MIEALLGTVTRARGARRAGIAFLAGALSVLAMAPFFLWPVLFLTLPILVLLTDGACRQAGSLRDRARSAGVGGWWFGFGYFLFGLFWIGEAFLVEADVFAWLLPFAVTLLPAGLALFTAIALGATALAWRPGAPRLMLLAAALGATEWLRGHVLTGFPWNVLGYGLTAPGPLMQSAGLFGIYGLTILTMAIFAWPLVALADRAHGASTKALLVRSVAPSLAALAALWAYGTSVLSVPQPPDASGVRVRIVQPSVPQREKWLPEKQGDIFRLHLELSQQNEKGETDGLAGITHVLWPEAAMPFRPLEHQEALDAIAATLPGGTVLISGGLRAEAGTETGARRAWNSLIAIDSDGAPAAIYDKIHLVPFGEYLPFQPVLEAIGFRQLTKLRGGFTPGVSPRPLFAAGTLPRAVALVCYEAIFPGAVVQGAERPALLLNVTNDGWFGDTTGPRQHLHQARVRAVEEGLPLLRAANNGISAVIDGHGQIRSELGMNIVGVIDTTVPAALPATPYGHWGDGIFALLLVAALLFALMPDGRARRL